MAATVQDGEYRFEHDGWIYVHLEGSPEQIGFQHGSLLAAGNRRIAPGHQALSGKIDQARLELLPPGFREDAVERH